MVNDGDAKKELKKEKNKKLPKEVSQEIIKKIFKNLLKTAGIMVYFIFLNIIFKNTEGETLDTYIQVFSCIFLAAGIILIEKAYKKDSGTIAINGIEFLVLALHSLSIMHITTLLKYDVKFYLLTSSYVFAIYYVLKSIVLYTKGRKDYLNSLSDISEIVKKEEPIKKEAKKRSETERNIEAKNEKTKPKTNAKPKSAAKKGARKSNKKIPKEEIEEKAPVKKKTTKAKSEVKKEQKEKIVTKKKAEEKAKVQPEQVVEKKKRGRPKKEVSKND